MIVIWEFTDQWSCVLPACQRWFDLCSWHWERSGQCGMFILFCCHEVIFSDQWSLCLLVIVWFVLRTSRMCFGQWGMFCYEAILLKTDWWSRYKLFWLVELLIFFWIIISLWNIFLVIEACDCFSCYCSSSQPYVWRSWSRNFGLVERWFLASHGSN